MADNFKFGKSKEDLREMRDLLLDIRTDIQSNLHLLPRFCL